MLIKGLHCTICRRSQAPKLARPDHIRHTIGQFNEVVLADLFYVKDVAAVTHHFMLMIDEGTSFVIIVPCPDHSATNFVNVIETHWLMWAGPPDMVVADGEMGFSSDEFARGLGKADTMYIAVAAYAPGKKESASEQCRRPSPSSAKPLCTVGSTPSPTCA